MIPNVTLNDDALLSPLQLYEWIGKPPGALANLRSDGKGPPFVKMGRLVRYRVGDVREWMEKEHNDWVESEKKKRAEGKGRPRDMKPQAA